MSSSLYNSGLKTVTTMNLTYHLRLKTILFADEFYYGPKIAYWTDYLTPDLDFHFHWKVILKNFVPEYIAFALINYCDQVSLYFVFCCRYSVVGLCKHFTIFVIEIPSKWWIAHTLDCKQPSMNWKVLGRKIATGALCEPATKQPQYHHDRNCKSLECVQWNGKLMQPFQR